MSKVQMKHSAKTNKVHTTAMSSGSSLYKVVQQQCVAALAYIK